MRVLGVGAGGERDLHASRNFLYPSSSAHLLLEAGVYVMWCPGSHDCSLQIPISQAFLNLQPCCTQKHCQPCFHSTAKVPPAKVWGSLKFDFVRSQKSYLYKVDSIPKTEHGLFDLLTSLLQTRNIPLCHPTCAFGSSGVLMREREHTA